VMDTGMTALPAAAAMVTIIIKSENLSRMMVSFCLAVCYCHGIRDRTPKPAGRGS
jgi:hypothetical protein